ncbi:MAG: hypothetical protein Q8T13_19895 [Acidobacteriota bacterium]|nr:hypothetical protein [Acidobacteriota bacterium]
MRELSEARNERDRHHEIAQQAVHLLHDQHLELMRLRERYYALLDARRADRKQAA